MLIRLAAAVEDASERPIARAITGFGRERLGRLPAAEGFNNNARQGVEAVVDGHKVTAGRRSQVTGPGLALTPSLLAKAEELEEGGATVIAVSSDGQVLGLVALADRVKPTSRQAVAELRALGLTPVLLTGDNERTARAVAAEVGIERVVAQADLGLSIGTGTDIAIEACDLTLVFGDLRAAADAIALSRRTLATIKGNLFWAFAYNVVAVPLAIAGVCLIPRLWFSSTGALGLAPALISAVRPAGPGPGEARPLLAPGTPAARNLPALSC